MNSGVKSRLGNYLALSSNKRLYYVNFYLLIVATTYSSCRVFYVIRGQLTELQLGFS